MKAGFDLTPHLEDLWRYARVLTRDDADADDLVQDALARALRLASTYDASRPLMPWLVRIVRNTFLTGVARSAAERVGRRDYAAFGEPALPPVQEQSVELAEVGRAMRSLPVEQAEVLHLVAVLGFAYAEAATVLDVPMGTVMSRLSRARAGLRAALSPKTKAPPISRLRIVGGTDDAA